VVYTYHSLISLCQGPCGKHMYLYIHVHIHTSHAVKSYIHIYIYVYTNTYFYMNVHVCMYMYIHLRVELCMYMYIHLRVEFLLKTDSGYPRDAEVTLFTLANPEHFLRLYTRWSAPPVSALARSGGPGKMSQSPVSRNSNIERRLDRPRAVVGVIRGVA